ncbi:hypothetical protein BJP23_17200 [Aeromonas veronii bv. veronii]|nr:hypothetical protein BJP23_17200 [Aeromonas veronii bv. veronii]
MGSRGRIASVITQRLGFCGWSNRHQAFGWMGPDDGDQVADFFVITADVPQRCAIKKAIAVAMA